MVPNRALHSRVGTKGPGAACRLRCSRLRRDCWLAMMRAVSSPTRLKPVAIFEFFLMLELTILEESGDDAAVAHSREGRTRGRMEIEESLTMLLEDYDSRMIG